MTLDSLDWNNIIRSKLFFIKLKDILLLRVFLYFHENSCKLVLIFVLLKQNDIYLSLKNIFCVADLII
jgi:hypothetical protein